MKGLLIVLGGALGFLFLIKFLSMLGSGLGLGIGHRKLGLPVRPD